MGRVTLGLDDPSSRVSMDLTWGSLTHPNMEIACMSQLKALPCNQISYIWKGNPKYFRTLPLTRKIPHIKGFRWALYNYINHKPFLSWGTQILPSSYTFEFLEILLSLNNLRRVFGRYPTSAFWLVLLFCSSSTSIGTCVDDYRSPLMRRSLHKYKCLWDVWEKARVQVFRSELTHTNIYIYIY